MAKRNRQVEETDQAGTPKAYNQDTAKAAGDAAAERAKQNPNMEPVPDGGMYNPDPDMEDRAAAAKAEAAVAPVVPPGEIPSPAEFAAARAKTEQMIPPNISGEPMSQGPQPEPEHYKYLLVIEYGGRFRAIGFTDFMFMRGYVQEKPGTKRLFQIVPGQAELQEIKGNGEPIHR